MKQSDVKLGTMYGVRPGRVSYSLCKVRQYGQVWVKVVAGHDTRRYGNLDIIERYHPNQVVLVVANDGATECYQVLVGGEVLTMQGRSWRSMIEVK